MLILHGVDMLDCVIVIISGAECYIAQVDATEAKASQTDKQSKDSKHGSQEYKSKYVDVHPQTDQVVK